MGLFHLDDGAPRCLGNCNQGRAPCTFPGVCTATRAPRARRIRMHWTCCNACHRSHRWLITARAHWLWLRLAARFA